MLKDPSFTPFLFGMWIVLFWDALDSMQKIRSNPWVAIVKVLFVAISGYFLAFVDLAEVHL